jgi:predicted DNA-binding transcriptional regulator AlpA
MGFESKDRNPSIPQKPLAAGEIKLLTPKEVKERLKIGLSWLAKARMRGDGPPFIKIGRAIRYSEAAIQQWMKSRQRLSTSEQ